ncbi:unnamed protein product [Pylaiella littoralis]
MPRSLASSNWLPLLALVHFVGRANAFSPFGAGSGTSGINRGNSNYTCRRLHSSSVSSSSNSGGGVLQNICCRRRPMRTRGGGRGGGGEMGLNMQQSYRDDAEAEFYAERLQGLITHNTLLTANAYWMELRGDMYAEWLNRYIKEQGGVEDIGWHAFLAGMMRAPPEDIIVRKVVKSPRGGSGNNPFLADRKPVEYTETVEPMSIARRLMEIREQVAEQLSADLTQMTAENDSLEEDYQYESELGPDKASALRLSSMQPMMEVDPSSGTANPPRRRSTYKDALDLVTAASMNRVKAQLRIRGDRVTLDWLDRFSDRELDHRGNELLQSLFAGPMVLVKDPLRDRPKVVEPLKVAQEIMQVREVVAGELIAVLRRVPADHQAMTVSLLNEKWDSSGDPEAGEQPPLRELE